MGTQTKILVEGDDHFINRLGRTVVYTGELLRHRAYTRFLHWTYGIFFFLALLSGFALYLPWLYRWLSPLFGGGAITRLLHPWFGLGFAIFFALQIVNWLVLMRWTPADSAWMRRLREYVTEPRSAEPPDTGFFNGGQKLMFWVIAMGTIVFLITGVMMWFPETFGQVMVSISYVLHDIAALILLGFIIIHIYLSTIGETGTAESMTRGTVSEAWAWTHHPGWYREMTGRDPREAMQEAQRKMNATNR